MVVKKIHISKLFRKIILVLIIIILLLFFYFFSLLSYDDIDRFKEFILGFGLFAPLIFIIIMALAVVISPIPSLPMAAASGIIFGVFFGIFYSVIGSVIGAVVAFMIARVLGREWILKKFGKGGFFLEKYKENNLLFIIFVMRLFPFFQFDIVSYGAGLTKIRLWKFTLATLIGMIPMTYVFVKSGELLVSKSIFGILFIVIIVLGMYVVARFSRKNI